MIELGKTQQLEVVKTTNFGVYLNTFTGPENEKVLLPQNQVPEGCQMGDELDVFIYRDSEDRLIATTIKPSLELGQTALLKVVEVTTIGAFLDWGLPKDLLLPFKEQTSRVHVGDQVLIALYIDKSNRLCGTMKVYEYLGTDSPYQVDDRVIGTIYEIIEDIGAFVAVDNLYSALIPKKELFQAMKPGDSVEARVTSVLEDGKLNLSVREKVHIQMDADAKLILDKLEESGGSLPYHDKTAPEEIKLVFNLSKNAFKRAVGRLLKEDKIILSSKGITLK